MHNNSIFTKTEKGLEEISTRRYGLLPKSRQILILIDGKTTIGDLTWKMPNLGMLVDAITELEAGGFIAETGNAKKPLVSSGSASAASPTRSIPPMEYAQFGELLRQELAVHLGPLAGIVVEESLPKEPTAISQHMMIVIIGAVAEEIDDVHNRDAFVKHIYERLHM